MKESVDASKYTLPDQRFEPLSIAGVQWIMRTLIVLLFFQPVILAAQHCGYDFASIIVVHAHRANSPAVVPHMRITLLDTNNLPAVINGQEWNRFRPNDGRSVLPDRAWQPHFERYSGQVFPFASDNYVLVVPSRLDYSGYSILVQDERNGGLGELRRTVVPISNDDVYPLCGRYDEDVYPPLEGRPNFAPVDIMLQTR
jgi:hypothetical protein